MLEHRDQVHADSRLVDVVVAGGEQGDLAGGRARGRSFGLTPDPGFEPLAQGIAVVLGDPRLGVDAEREVQELAADAGSVRGVDNPRDHGNARKGPDPIGVGQELIPRLGLALFVFQRLSPQHQVRKVQIPLVGRDIGALGHEAQVAQIAMVHDLPIGLLGYPIHLHGVRLVHQVKQGGKGLTQADATPATVANVIDPFEFLEQGAFLEELGIGPLDRVPGGCLQVAFAHCHVMGPVADAWEMRESPSPAAPRGGVPGRD